MFFVFNRSKIYSYMIALSTVTLLFIAAATLNDVVTPINNSIETSTNAVKENVVTNNMIEESNTRNIVADE